MAEGHREAARSVLDVREHDGTLRMRRTDSQQLLPSKTTAIAARQHTRCPGKDNGCYLKNDGRPLDMAVVGTFGPADGYGLE